MGFKTDFYGVSLIFLEELFGNSIGFPWGFFGNSTVVL